MGPQSSQAEVGSTPTDMPEGAGKRKKGAGKRKKGAGKSKKVARKRKIGEANDKSQRKHSRQAAASGAGEEPSRAECGGGIPEVGGPGEVGGPSADNKQDAADLLLPVSSFLVANKSPVIRKMFSANFRNGQGKKQADIHLSAAVHFRSKAISRSRPLHVPQRPVASSSWEL